MPLYNNKAIRYFLLLLCLFSLNAVFARQDGGITQIKTVVIDPGHGGHDPGTITSGARYREKDIVLSVGLKLGSLIKNKYPHIKVIYTRSTDKFVDLAERSDIANRNKADLFISIHVNATKSTGVHGTETFVMGTHKSDSNFELCKAENAVIVMEDNYQAKYEGFNPDSPESYIIFSLLQNTHLEQSLKLAELVQNHFKQGPIYGNRGVKQGGLIVLWRSTMPAILTEIGFLSNPKDRAVLITKEGQNKIAGKLFTAFCKYKESYESGTENAVTGTASKNAPVKSSVTQNQVIKTPGNNHAVLAENEYYSIQILSVNKILKKNARELKGRKDYRYIKTGTSYKYIIGKYTTRQKAIQALPGIRKNFPGAFIIHVNNNKIVK